MTLFILFLFAVIFWLVSGLKKVPVGWKVILSYFGKRIKGAVREEGWQLILWPWGANLVDCRQKSVGIDPLTVLTSDNIQVEIAGTLISRVVDLYKYLDVDPQTIKKGLDDIWDEVIRTQIVDLPFETVRKMHVEVSESAKEALADHATNSWGIEVIKIPVTIKPKSTDVVADLERVAREDKQRQAQEIELQHFAKQVRALMVSLPDGPGLTREQAIEQVQMSLGQLKKEMKAQAFALDPAAAALIAKILGK